MTSHFRETRLRSHAAGDLACSICGTHNAYNAGFCRCCGVSITRASGQMALPEGSGFCKTCQCAHTMPARFCDQCGGKLPGYIRPPDSYSQSGCEAAGTGVADVTGKTAEFRASMAGETSGPSVTANDRRSSMTPYLLMPALCAVVVIGMYFNGYRMTQVDAGELAPLQVAGSLPSATLHPAAVPLKTGQDDAFKEVATFDAASIEPAQAGPDDPQASLPVPAVLAAIPPTTVTPAVKPLRRPAISQSAMVEEDYEEPVTVIRELPTMPVHDFKSVVPLDASRN